MVGVLRRGGQGGVGLSRKRREIVTWRIRGVEEGQEGLEVEEDAIIVGQLEMRSRRENIRDR